MEVVRNAIIKGAPAKAVVRPLLYGPGHEYRSVKEAADVDREKEDPADVHCCPLCNEYFGPRAFEAHAPECIRIRAPRWERQQDTDPQLKQRYSRIFGGG